MATVTAEPANAALCEIYGIAEMGIPERYWDRIAEALQLAEECTPATRPAPFVPCSPLHRKCNRAHAEMMSEFRLAQERQAIRAERATGGWPTEIMEYYRDVEPRLTLPVFLKQWKGVA